MKLLIALIPRVKELINEMKSIIKNPEKSGRIIFLLVDIRHEPSQNDVDMYNWIFH